MRNRLDCSSNVRGSMDNTIDIRNRLYKHYPAGWPATDYIEFDHLGIPGADNHWFPSRDQARHAALQQATRVGSGCRIVHDRYPSRGLPHYHVVCPILCGGQLRWRRVSGHLFYGRRQPYKVLRRKHLQYELESDQRWTPHEKLKNYTKVKSGLKGIYKLYRNNRLVTIGQSADLRARLGQHLKNVRRYFWGNSNGWTFRYWPMVGSTEAIRKRKETAVIRRNCPLVPHQCRQHRELQIDPRL
ncbi:MAG: hypothetical protein KDJ52_04610 [Anaerolineae bacterium]|nr:hypothetical protein [Anaerolineae bacterium]